MDIELSSINKIANITNEINNQQPNQNAHTPLDEETKQALNKAAGLVQTIVAKKIPEEVLRKMPSDEYLHLLSLLDEIIGGSIDKHV